MSVTLTKTSAVPCATIPRDTCGCQSCTTGRELTMFEVASQNVAAATRHWSRAISSAWELAEVLRGGSFSR